MEATLAKMLLVEVYDSTDRRVNVGNIVTEDDSTMRKHCRSVGSGGSLRNGIYEPKFLAYPDHRVKVMVKSIYSKVNNTEKKDKVKNIGAMRLKIIQLVTSIKTEQATYRILSTTLGHTSNIYSGIINFVILPGVGLKKSKTTSIETTFPMQVRL